VEAISLPHSGLELHRARAAARLHVFVVAA